MAEDINLSPEFALSPDSSGRLFNGSCVSFVEDRVDICDIVEGWGKILDDDNDGQPEFLTPALPRSFSHESDFTRITEFGKACHGIDTALKLWKRRKEIANSK